MKKLSFSIMVLLSAALLFFAACSDDDSTIPNPEQQETGDDNNADGAVGKTLVVYFSQTVPDGVDATTGATNVVNENNNSYGANQYLALMIAGKTGADVLRLTVADGYYPVEYNDLAAFARDERDNGTHPALTSPEVSMSDYTNVIISTPIWWYTIPMPVYSFLDAYDLSGKHVFVATTHAGSGLANAIEVISSQEPGATVSDDGFSVRASQVSASISSDVDSWLRRLGFHVND